MGSIYIENQKQNEELYWDNNMAELNVDGLLDRLLGGEPSAVTGLVDEDDYAQQKSFDRFLGGINGYKKARQEGLGIAGTGLTILQDAKKAGRATDARYANALKDRTSLTKGMLDVKKLGFDVKTLQRMDVAQKNELIDAILSEDYERVNLIRGNFPEYTKAKIGQLYPKTADTPYSTSLRQQELTQLNIPKDKQIKILREYNEAPSPIDKAKYRVKAIKDLFVEYPAAYKKVPNLTSTTELANNSINQSSNLNNQPQQQNSVDSIPLETIGIPSTGLTPAPDVETYEMGGYDINNKPISPSPTENLTQKYVNNNNRVERYNNYTNMKSNERGLASGEDISTKQLQEWKNESPKKLKTAQQSIRQLNGLSSNLSQLVNHKGFSELFSKGGDISAMISNDAIDASKLFKKIVKTIGLVDLVQMKLDSPNGATPFGQLNFSELQMVLDAITEAQIGGGEDNAIRAFSDLSDKLYSMTDDISTLNTLIHEDNNDRTWNTYKEGIQYVYQESPMLEGLGSDKILSGAVMNAKFGTSSFDNNTYYFSNDDGDGNFDPVENTKTNKPLTIQDIMKNNYNKTRK